MGFSAIGRKIYGRKFPEPSNPVTKSRSMANILDTFGEFERRHTYLSGGGGGTRLQIY